jgi:DNA-binding transcriptional LysR family regulator
MPRHINLRQVEAFKAVIENGTISRAAEILHVSQPAMSKLIAHFEFDTGLKLFDRHKGRLAPTENGMRLYNEIDRIFAGIRQVENAVDVIRREEQGRISIGVLPALAGSFIQRVTTRFLRDRPNVFCSIHSRSSWGIVDWVVSRKFDVGLVDDGFKNPYVTLEPLMEQPMVCVMPLDHPLTAKATIEPRDLDQAPFVSFPLDSDVGHRVATLFETHGVKPRIVLVANFVLTVCEFVAAGLGVSLVHPVLASGVRHQLAIRRFEPDVCDNVVLCRNADSRNAELVDIFAQKLRETAEEVSREMRKNSPARRRRI